MADEKIYCGSGKKSQQYDIINLNICVSDIPKEHIQDGGNGKKYVRLNVSAKREADKYGNTHSISVDTWKPQKKTENTVQTNQTPIQYTDLEDQLPF